MARTKHVSQASGAGKAATCSSAGSLPTPTGSPEYFPDDQEAVDQPRAQGDSAGSLPPTPTPSQPATTGKRKVREPANSTPLPAKKKSKAVPAQQIVVVSDNEETFCDSSAEADVDDIDDLETPKASQLNARSKRNAGDLDSKPDRKGKKKAGNLKTELGGEIGVDAVDDVFAAQDGESGGTAVTLSLPSSEFTVENKDKWAGSFIEVTKTHLFVKARSSDNPLLANKVILDPYMSKHGYYDNLPNANCLLLPSTNESAATGFTSGTLTSVVPGLSISTWDCFGVERSYIASILRFPNQGQYVNPSTVDVTDLVFKEAWSSQGPGSAFIACDKRNGVPVVFASVGGIMESFVAFGKNIGATGGGPHAKGIVYLGHRLENERLFCLVATLWHGEDINASIKRRHITMQTLNRRNTDVDNNIGNQSERRVGKMEITSYASPAKKYTPKNKTSLDFADEVPVYDGCEEAFDPKNFAQCIGRLPKYRSEDGEVPEGTGALVGYTLSTSSYNGNWKLTFNLLWVVVLAN